MSPQPTPQPSLRPSLAMPIENGPSVTIPQTDIAHMGTSQVTPPAPPPTTSPEPAPMPMPPLPDGITQEAVNAAIAQVEHSATTDGLSPEVLAAACAQLEVHAKAQGIDLNQAVADPNATPNSSSAPPSPPHVEAAVLDKKSVMDEFGTQREALKNAVRDQREAMQQPYKDALAKAAPGTTGEGTMNAAAMTELAAAMKDLDPATVALINAIGAMNANPSILNNVMWIEIIRAVRTMIAQEAKKQLHELLTTPAAS